MTITISFDDEKLKAIIEQVLNDRESKKEENPGASTVLIESQTLKSIRQ